MKIGILGSGIVGQGLGEKLVEIGHEVVMGTKSPEKLTDWLGQFNGNSKVTAGTYAQAAAHGDLIIDSTLGSETLNVLRKNFNNISNPLDFTGNKSR